LGVVNHGGESNKKKEKSEKEGGRGGLGSNCEERIDNRRGGPRKNNFTSVGGEGKVARKRTVRGKKLGGGGGGDPEKFALETLTQKNGEGEKRKKERTK